MTGFFGSSDSNVLLSLKPRIVEVRKRALTDLNNVDELVELLMDHYGRVTDRDSLSSTWGLRRNGTKKIHKGFAYPMPIISIFPWGQ